MGTFSTLLYAKVCPFLWVSIWSWIRLRTLRAWIYSKVWYVFCTYCFMFLEKGLLRLVCSFLCALKWCCIGLRTLQTWIYCQVCSFLLERKWRCIGMSTLQTWSNAKVCSLLWVSIWSWIRLCTLQAWIYSKVWYVFCTYCLMFLEKGLLRLVCSFLWASV